MNGNKLKNFISGKATLVAVIVIFVVASIAVESFFSVNNFVNLFRKASMIGIMAIGGTFVILAGGIDLSVGSLPCLGSRPWLSALPQCKRKTRFSCCLPRWPPVRASARLPVFA